MTEDIKESNREKYETLHTEIRKKNHEKAKEQWINDKYRNIELYCRGTSRQCTKTLRTSLDGKHTHPQVLS